MARKTKIGREHLMIPDTQVREGVKTDHIEALGNYIVHKRPDVVIHIGDHFDMPSLATTYHKRGSKYFEGQRYASDIESGLTAFGRLEKALVKERRRGYDPEKHYFIGNHEDRIDRYVEDDPLLEGSISMADITDRLEAWGWVVHDYLDPATIDGVTYAHYFYNPKTGRPFSGTAFQRLKNLGFSFSQGHQQGLDWAQRDLSNRTRQMGLIAGSFYEHDEEYRGPQATNEYRGVVYKHEVHDGQYDLMMVSLDYLKREWL